MNIPSAITAGDSISWTDGPGRDYLNNLISPPVWTLTYEIKGATVLTVTGTTSLTGNGWDVALTAAQTSAFVPGTYYFQAYATNGSARVTLGSGQFTVLPNLAAVTSAGYDGRSQTQKDLEAVQAAMRAMISGGAITDYSIAGRSVRKMPMADLIALETRLKVLVAREKKQADIANGLGNPSNVYVRFKK